jgi:hypothetical protein
MNFPASWAGVSVLSNEKPVSFPPAASQLLLVIHMIAAPLLVGVGVHPGGDMNLVESGAGDRKPFPGTQLNQNTPIGTTPVLFSVMLY